MAVTDDKETPLMKTQQEEDEEDEATVPPTANKIVSDLCCFYLKFGTCHPPRPPCRWRHVKDDDNDAKLICCFGATCRIGHATRALPKSANKEQRQAYWKQYYALQPNKKTDSNNKNTETDATPQHIVGMNPSVRDSHQLRSQLEPWTTSILRDRLAQVFGQDRASLDPLPRGVVMDQLLRCYRQHFGENNERHIVRVQGSPVRDNLCQNIVMELCKWRDSYDTNNTKPSSQNQQQQQQQPANIRPSLNAAKYIVLRHPQSFDQPDSRKARKAARLLQHHQRLWDLATQALNECDPDFCKIFSALAVTHQLKGSPHIDKQDTRYFYGLSLGNFRSVDNNNNNNNNNNDGGHLCVEASWDTVARIDTHNRLAKVDGRFPHWVHHPYQGERFSLIYYSTHQDYQPPTQAFWGTSTIREGETANV